MEKDPFLDYHREFAKKHGISEEHLGVMVDSVWSGVRFYLNSSEMPSVRLNNFYSFFPSVVRIEYRLKYLFKMYRVCRVEDKSFYRKEFVRLNRIRKRRIIEKQLNKVSKCRTKTVKF